MFFAQSASRGSEVTESPSNRCNLVQTVQAIAHSKLCIDHGFNVWPRQNHAREDPGSLLRQTLANGKGTEKSSVLVEIDLPAQVIEFDEPSRTVLHRPPLGIKPESDQQRAHNAAMIENARESLTRLLGQPPLWLRSARAFVVEGSAEQLREIAHYPFTRAIRPNRRLEMSR